MKYKLTKLSNGLRVITVPIPNMESATVTIWVGVGSRYETSRTSGLSHFLEHMGAKGTKNRPTAKEIAEEIDSFGAQHNASTSKEWTNFYVKSRVANLEKGLDVLADLVLNPLLRKKDINMERGVILEEISMYEDTPMAHIWDIYERVIYKGNPLGRDIIGNRDTVKAATRKDFVNYRNTHYGSNNIVVTIAGGVSEKKALEMVRKYLGGLKKKQKREVVQFKNVQKAPRTHLESKKIEQAHLVLGYLGNPLGHKDRFAEGVLSAILGSGMSSRLFSEVREKRGLAYAIRTSADHNLDCGYVATYAGVDLKRVDEAIKVILDEHYKLRDEKKKIDKRELNKAKEYLKGHLALSLEDTKAVNAFFGLRELLMGKLETPDDVYDGIDSVTIGDVLRVAKKFFVPQRLNLAITGPFKKSSRFEKLVN